MFFLLFLRLFSQKSFLIFFALSSSLSSKMNSSVACQACRSPFIPDARHRRHQRFCLRSQCQLARRRQNQALRRSRTQPPLTSTQAMQHLHQGWLVDEAVKMKPYEAALNQFHPAIIGLISQIIDSPAPDDILAYLRRCMARGSDILFPPGPHRPHSPRNQR